MPSDSASTAFPLICLHPVADGQHAWVAVLLDTSAPAGCSMLARLFGEFGLFGALDTLPCIVTLADPGECAELGTVLPAERVVLRLPVADCLAHRERIYLASLREQGFALVADGLPAEGGDLGQDLGAVALPWGAEAEGPLRAALARRPGNHLAIGVETPEAFRASRELGFRWIAGNYPLHPDGAPLPRGTTRHALLLQLLTLITRDADSREIEALIKQDAHLSYQLLRLVNSVAFSLSTKITSFGQAITLLGRRQLQRWLQLLLYARPEAGARSPLLPRAALRGALMEALCSLRARDARDRAYMVGMFSLLDLIMGPPLAQILAPLHLAEDVEQALLGRTGALGSLLAAVEAAEAADFDTLAAALDASGIGPAEWAVALVQAYRWAIRVSAEA